MDKLRFADEGARQTAIAELGDDPKNLDKLNEIREADIGVEEKSPVSEGGKEAVGEEQKIVGDGKPVEDAVRKEIEVKNFTITSKDLPVGYDTPEKLFKSFKEKQDLIDRQTRYIKENLNRIPTSDAEKNALERAEKAEGELARLRQSTTQQVTAGTTGDIAAIQAEINRVDVMLTEMDKEAEKDADVAWTADYQKKYRELARIQTKNMNALAGLYVKAQHEIVQAKSATGEILENAKKSEQQRYVEAELDKQFTALDTIGNDFPELKLSRTSSEVEDEFVKWRDDIALAYYGRPARSNEEKFAAMTQLQLKNPDLLAKCQIMGVSTEASKDVECYLQLCDFLNYMDGWRKDPITGKLERVYKYDTETKKHVPLLLPNLKAAIQQKRLEEGYYEKQSDGAFQKGAESLAQASARRDQGAVLLDTSADQGQTPGGAQWAIRTLTEVDAEEAMKDYRRGDSKKMDDINKARKVMGMDPITFDV